MPAPPSYALDQLEQADTMTTSHRSKDEPPWDHENPKKSSGEKSQPLTPAQKASAKRAAKKAGRPYPNLVDNMHAAAKAKKHKE